MTSKKFINKPQNVVQQALTGLVKLNANLTILKNTHVVTLLKPSNKKVHLICGGGSGHEPAHAGFVDGSCLSAAVCGGVFASPPTQEIIKAIQHVANQNGVLIIIKNYTGDIINFESAAAYANANGILTKTLIVNDDIAFIDQDPNRQEARGLCGTVLLYKILGKAAQQGMSLNQLHSYGKSILKRLYTLNLSLGACSLPGHPARFSIKDNQFQLGLGIHGQKGKQTYQIKQSRSLIKMMFQRFRKIIEPQKSVCIILNNLGGCSQIEMGVLSNDLIDIFSVQYKIQRFIEGRLMTSLQMHGISITLFVLDSNIEINHIDAQLRVKYWKVNQINKSFYAQKNQTICQNNEIIQLLNENQTKSYQFFKKIFENMHLNIEKLDQIDRQVGDGDTGTSILRALDYLSKQNLINKLSFQHSLNKSLLTLGKIISTKSAGTLGTIFGSFISTFSQKVKSEFSENNIEILKEALSSGIQTIKNIGKCQLNDRTIIDVLQPLLEVLNALQKNSEYHIILKKLQQNVIYNCQRVKSLKAKKGRARYLGGKQIGFADPGCQLVKIIIQSLQ